MYENGEGVEQDYTISAKWYRKAAGQGNDSAQLNLGLAYYTGRGVPIDFVLAYMWFNLSAAQGTENAAKGRKLVEVQMSPEKISEAQKLTREWKPK